MFLSRSINNLKDIILGKDLKAMLISKKTYFLESGDKNYR